MPPEAARPAGPGDVDSILSIGTASSECWYSETEGFYSKEALLELAREGSLLVAGPAGGVDSFAVVLLEGEEAWVECIHGTPEGVRSLLREAARLHSGARWLRGLVRSDRSSTRAAFEAEGFNRGHSYRFYEAGFSGEVPEPPLPAGVSFRRAEPRDAGRLAAFLRSESELRMTPRWSYEEEQIRSALSSGAAEAFLLEAGGEVLASLVLRPEDRTLEVDDALVSRSQRATGLGTLLGLRVYNAFVRRGFKAMYCFSRPSQEAAGRFILSFGFKPGALFEAYELALKGQ